MFQNTTSLESALENRLLPVLETFPCPYAPPPATENGVIRIVFPEFTCVCPRTGYPDFAKISICYQPREKCLELKSWKLYLNSFRMIGAFHEAVTVHLFETLKTLLAPQWLLVVGAFSPRGNVDTAVLFETPTKRPQGVDLLIGPIIPQCKSL
jgi:7-cyano-7-deazaguanine reductase